MLSSLVLILAPERENSVVGTVILLQWPPILNETVLSNKKVCSSCDYIERPINDILTTVGFQSEEFLKINQVVDKLSFINR